nr:DUF6030 family protein [Jiella sp. LLJ827]
MSVVAVLVAGGLIAIFLNTDTSETTSWRIVRAERTGIEVGGASENGTAATDASAGGRDGHEHGDYPDLPVGARVPIPSAQLLLPAASRGTGGFVRLPLTDPAELCDAIDPGAEGMAWRESPLFAGRWECQAMATVDGEPIQPEQVDAVSEDDGTGEPPATPDLPKETRIFAMARGVEEEALNLVRFKLVAANERAARQGGVRLAELMQNLFQKLRWEMPSEVSRNLLELDAFDINQSGTRLRFFREYGDGSLYNLIVTFPDSREFQEAEAFHTLSPVGKR